MNQLTNIQQTMSSREIAELTGKTHDNVLKAIRNMEEAWVKVTGVKFNVSEYKDPTGRKLPMYELTKKESLYVATKFNDEARARLILRWEELEKIQLSPQTDAMVLANAFQILNNMVQEQQHQIAKLTPKGDYVDKLTASESVFTTTQIGAPFGLTAKKLHSFLIERGVIRQNSDKEYTLLAKYMNKGYEYYDPFVIEPINKTVWRLKWTELGRAFIHNLIDPFKRVPSNIDFTHTQYINHAQ